MTNNEILSKLANVKKGRYVHLKKEKELGEGIRKVSNVVVRLGVNYSNMQVVKNQEGDSQAIRTLPWGKWVEGLENLVIENKGNYYLRVANGYTNNNRAKYYKDGVEISKQEVISLLGEKKLNGKESPVYNIKFENILELG